MKFIALPIGLIVSLFPAFVAAAGPYDDALKAASKVLSTSPSEHDIFKGTSVYTRRELQVTFKLSESAHCELTIHRDSKITYSSARGALGPESPDPAKFYEIPLAAMVKDLVRKNEKSDEQSVNAGSISGNNTTTSKTYLNSEDTIVTLTGVDATGAKPNEVSSTTPPRYPAYGDEKSATAAIAALAALAAACK
jgi:hypothetical protein